MVAVHDRAVRDVMTRDVMTIHQESSFKAIVRALEERHVDAAPVVEDSGRLVGIVSESDLTCHEEAPPGVIGWLTKDGRDHARKSRGQQARDLMSTPVRTTTPDATVGSALREMARHKVGRLVVMDGDRITGLLTRSDLLRVFLREDEDICRDVRTEVAEALGDCPNRLAVEVEDGVVRLTGWTKLMSATQAASAAARAVPGVVEVLGDVESEVDDTVVHEMAVRGPFM